MQLLLIYYILGVPILFCKFYFENYNLIQVRYYLLLGVCWVFVVDMLMSFFFFILHEKIYVREDIQMYFGVIHTSGLMM